MALAFPELLLELARQDERICGVSCDCWGFLVPLASEYPERAIEIGIAEQNLISIGAGLAVRGKMPFVIGMNPFVTMRCFEQIRTDLGYGKRNVKVIGGYGGGLGYAGWGCTHHAMEETALMRLIPDMTVFMPADTYETEQVIRAAAGIDGPCFISNTGGEISIPGIEESSPFEFGKARLLCPGDDVAIFAYGPTVYDAIQAHQLLQDKGVGARVYSMPTIKPLDTAEILRAAHETRLLITIEEHTVIGGLGGAIAETLATAGTATPLRRLGLQDVFACMNGNIQDLKERFGINANAIVDVALA